MPLSCPRVLAKLLRLFNCRNSHSVTVMAMNAPIAWHDILVLGRRTKFFVDPFKLSQLMLGYCCHKLAV
jgi:hypothetical protein